MVRHGPSPGYLLRVALITRVFEYVNTISCSFMWESKCYLLRDSSRGCSVLLTVDGCLGSLRSKRRENVCMEERLNSSKCVP